MRVAGIILIIAGVSLIYWTLKYVDAAPGKPNF